ncbi:uncharacterized protein LOC108741575 [Agrilus planipennis]|uniref:Uncharacterized protein LOC108741575 n=1 Tax=Agrilus planipennis TaxID=224129 RepID=A0A1W4X7A7_AGRPL|nr:uncharacterized protein LOC108741575 [Agrilus planipennis]
MINDENSAASASNNNASAVVKLPDFWPKKIALWFTQVEIVFSLNRITKDDTKYMHIVSQLSPQYLDEIEDILMHPPAENKCETIKAVLIKRLSDSDAAKAQQLLKREEIGDRTPGQFWRHMKKLANSKLQDDLLIELWKSRLPIRTQEVITALDQTDGEELAEIADRIHFMPPTNSRVAAIESLQSPSICDQFTKIIEGMEAMQLEVISAITKNSTPNRSRSRSRSQRNNRGRSNCRRQFATC